MLTIEETFDFLGSTFVDLRLLKVVGLDGLTIVPLGEFVYISAWERRYDLQKLRELFCKGHTFVIHSSNVSPKVRSLVERLETKHQMSGQAHVYMGENGSRSFPIHADNPENYIHQCVGESKFTLYNETAPQAGNYPDSGATVDFSRVLKPGDEVYIPSRRLHFFQPLTARLSISVPLDPNATSCPLSSVE